MSSPKVSDGLKGRSASDPDCLSCKLVTSGVFLLVATYFKIAGEQKPRAKKIPMYFVATVSLTAAIGSLMDTQIKGVYETLSAKWKQEE